MEVIISMSIRHVNDMNNQTISYSISKQLIDCFKRGNKVLICGNGGSASQANHFAAEFVCKYAKDRKPLPAISLCANNSLLTAIPNDYGFENVFSRQVKALGKPGDVLITLSTSGKSMNVKKAIIQASLLDMNVIDFPRKGEEVGEIQNYQLKLMHSICKKVEDAFI